MKRVLESYEQEKEDLLKEIEDLKKENLKLKGEIEQINDLKCYVCSSIDNAKYKCKECSRLMCLDHVDKCGYCGSEPYCGKCASDQENKIYCQKCRMEEGSMMKFSCCFECGVADYAIDKKIKFNMGCSYCNFVYVPEVNSKPDNKDDSIKPEENVPIKPNLIKNKEEIHTEKSDDDPLQLLQTDNSQTKANNKNIILIHPKDHKNCPNAILVSLCDVCANF